MTNFAKIGKIFLWIASFFLALSLFLLPLLLSATNNIMYAKGYEENGAYERLPQEDVWIITENVQEYFRDESELMYFSTAEKEHLEEVKDLIRAGWTIFVLLISLFAPAFGLYFRFSYQAKFGKYKGTTREEISKEFFNCKDPAKKKFHLTSLRTVFRKSGISLFTLLIIMSLLASSWEWFFTLFHNTLFSGQWMFETSTLMIQLWDHPFFLVAAKIIVKKIGIIAIVLFACSYVLETFQKKVK